MLEASRRWRSAGRSIGLVPTMGALHAGHLSLVDAARRENEIVVVSIFVNPIQFGPNEDFERYPRDPERDAVLLGEAGVDAIYEPPIAAMYPPGASTRVRVGGVAEPLEGKARPGHFEGVATVVTKLFAAVQPDRAYFGQKDAQQVAVVRRMVRDLAVPVEICVVPTVRDADGLALSSRIASENCWPAVSAYVDVARSRIRSSRSTCRRSTSVSDAWSRRAASVSSRSICSASDRSRLRNRSFSSNTRSWSILTRSARLGRSR